MNVATRNSQHVAEDDPFGLAAWASVAGTTEEAAAVQLGVILAGATGPQAFIGDQLGARELPPLTPVLISPGARRPRSVDALRGPLMEMAAHLRQRFSAFSSIHFEEARSQMLQKTNHLPASLDPAQDRVQLHMRALEADECSSHLDEEHRDLAPDPALRRFRTVMRPGLILENPDLRLLSELVGGCHDSYALIPGLRLDRLVSADPRDRERLFDLIEGRDVPLPKDVKGTSIVGVERGALRALLLASRHDLQDMMGKMPDFGERVLLVDATPLRPVSGEISSIANAFGQRHAKIVRALQNCRRKGFPPPAREWTREGWDRFDADVAEFWAACDASGVPCAALRDLPAVLRWTFEQCALTSQTDDALFTGTVRRVSRALLATHRRLWLELTQEAAFRAIFDLAEQIVLKIRVKQPVPWRQLVRSFDIQRSERYRPLINVLVHADVIAEGPGSVFRLGNRRLDEVQEQLRSEVLRLP